MTFLLFRTGEQELTWKMYFNGKRLRLLMTLVTLYWFWIIKIVNKRVNSSEKVQTQVLGNQAAVALCVPNMIVKISNLMSQSWSEQIQISSLEFDLTESQMTSILWFCLHLIFFIFYYQAGDNEEEDICCLFGTFHWILFR